MGMRMGRGTVGGWAGVVWCGRWLERSSKVTEAMLSTTPMMSTVALTERASISETGMKL